jgi:hypothetical protein
LGWGIRSSEVFHGKRRGDLRGIKIPLFSRGKREGKGVRDKIL